MWQIKNSLAVSTLLSKHGVKHFTTTRQTGNTTEDSTKKELFLSNNLTYNTFASSKQIHENIIKIISSKNEAARYDGYDGFITLVKGVSLGVFTADCVPVFLADKNNMVIGVLHAGWKGIKAGIVEAGIEIFKKDFDISPLNIIAGIGPHICDKCYQVGSEFQESFPENYKNGYLNMNNEIELRLICAGVAGASIDSAVKTEGFCTFHNNDSFFSYRKNEKDRRLLSLITL
ncbi:MAG: hypothetical protein A2252_04400 [Elusimicrobia bacterium RIFOXYA2_FULL_39_19]|nr:MAG: hypothetical protein A2252_04400 [Elusimicrobia bacterium RIFOXYA2_FULL_39_19]